MASRVEVLLEGMPADFAQIRGFYERDVDLRAALDWTATDLDRKFGAGKDPSPYFPLRTSPTDFAGTLAKDFPGAPAEVKAALERHQPFQMSREVLAQLPKLYRVNGHQDFTQQTRTERRQWQQGGVTWGEGVTFQGNVQIDDQRAGDPRYTTESVLVGWTFLNPPVDVLPTLGALADQVTDAVRDVRAAAGL